MDYKDFAAELCLEGKVVAIKRTNHDTPDETRKTGCSLRLLNDAMSGERVVLTAANAGCLGSVMGMGLSDTPPEIPGGFGNFISHGAGEGFPPGEHIKKTPELAYEMASAQPQKVNGGFNAVEFAPYGQLEDPDLVTFLVNPDQLSALVHIYGFEKPDYDNVIMPMVSGCASVVRIPLGEMEKGENARAVVGNVDVFSRPHFPENTFFFTIPAACFEHMLSYAEESVVSSPIWRSVGNRLKAEKRD